ncbi:hypothetical protein DFJ73DRAFT_831733 [Zopfochytrium polystomum]|nr:hypothetical protein DFJ73DRAFT_831733 [Zopfochytrium polystomum]
MPMIRDASAGSIISSISSLPEGSTRRDKVVFEIVETERRYLSDMKILKKVYAEPAAASRIFPPADWKVLFGSLDTVIETSTSFLAQLDAAEKPQGIAKAFLDMIPELEKTYTEYCKHNEAAMTKLADFASKDCPPNIKSFLKDCQVQLQGQTGAWDLSSLVIKPVQRVLKYPLLIQELVKDSTPDDADFETLKTVYEKIERVAETINEVKKRKDTVEKYVEGKGHVNVIHGISKKLTRGVQGIKQKTGTAGEITRDESFDELLESFNRQFLKIQSLNKYLALWTRSVKEYLESQERLAIALEEVYMIPQSDLDPGTTSKYLFVLVEYRKACERLSKGAWKDAEEKIKQEINPSLSVLLSKFREPKLVITKREKKRLDYDRAKALKTKGDVIDKALEESADAYVSLNSELLDQIPKFLKLVTDYLSIVLQHIRAIQAKIYEEIRDQLGPVADMVEEAAPRQPKHRKGRDRRSVGGGVLALERYPKGEIINSWKEAMERGEGGSEIESRIREIGLLYRWMEDVWLNDDFSDTSSISTPRHWSKSNRKDSSDFESPPRHSRSYSGSLSIPRGHRQTYSDAGGEGRSPSGLSPRISVLDVPSRSAGRYASSARGADTTPHHWRDHSPTPSSSYNGSTMDGADDEATEDDDHGQHGSEPQAGFWVVALYPFAREFDDEMELEYGDSVWVDQCGGRGGEPAPEWWHGRLGEREGWFPSTYVERPV